MFQKFNPGSFADALLCEAQGLQALRNALADTEIGVPEVYHVDEHRMDLSHIATGTCGVEQGRKLGRGLAQMHSIKAESYGWPTDNYIGLNPQCNGLSHDWGEFFVSARLEFQLAMVRRQGQRLEWQQRLAACRSRLVDYLNAHVRYPSLVHGDLWSGNYLCDSCGQVWLIDPAVYWADREVDIAMTEMFGGFPDSFHKAYSAQWPLCGEYPRKRQIYNLYHYLNHYNLFGGGYLSSCEAGMEAIEKL